MSKTKSESLDNIGEIMNKIICPHCGHEYTDEDMIKSQHDLYKIASDEEPVEENCIICETTFTILGGYIPTYETFKTWDEYDRSV